MPRRHGARRRKVAAFKLKLSRDRRQRSLARRRRRKHNRPTVASQ